jgi:hypothetical protein
VLYYKDTKQLSGGHGSFLHSKANPDQVPGGMVMKCLKENHCNGKPDVRTQRRPIPIMVSVFLLAAFIIFVMAPVADAQSPSVPKTPLTTLQEDRILSKQFMEEQDITYDVEHYVRDGCKEALTGDWRWEGWGDIVTITYDEQYKVFLGRVKQPVKMGVDPNYLLFKAYFPNLDYSRLFARHSVTRAMSYDGLLAWLRDQKQCRGRGFDAIEYSFDKVTKRKIETRFVLFLAEDQLQYKLDKKAWFLRRIP